MAAGSGRRASSMDLWILSWRVGGPSQRRFALIAALAPALSAAAMVVAMLLLFSERGMGGVFAMFYPGFVAVAAWPAFQRAVYAPMRGPAFWQAKVANGWVPRVTQDFYLELSRYKDQRGTNGQLPGDMAWGWLYFGIYVGTMFLAIVMVWLLAVWSVLAVTLAFSLVEFPLAFGCMFLYSRRNRRQFDRAVAEGYGFATFRLGALRRLQP